MSDKQDQDQLSKEKRIALESFLAEGLVQVRVDSNVDDVVLPDFLMNRVQVTLNLSYAFQSEVFEIDDEGVQVSLSFSGQNFLCILPWPAFYFMQALDKQRNSKGLPALFIDSIPHSILEHYGLTMHILEEEDEEQLPVTRPIHATAEDEYDEYDEYEDDEYEDDEYEEMSRAITDLKDWAQSLEHVDTRPKDYKWPLPLEVIYEVVEEFESQKASSKRVIHAPKDTSTQRHSKLNQHYEEGEHTPEKGIISLIRFQKERDLNDKSNQGSK